MKIRYKCSNCGKVFYIDGKYMGFCPVCGFGLVKSEKEIVRNKNKRAQIIRGVVIGIFIMSIVIWFILRFSL